VHRKPGVDGQDRGADLHPLGARRQVVQCSDRVRLSVLAIPGESPGTEILASIDTPGAPPAIVGVGGRDPV
jgi:hypothetical protein